MDNEQPNYLGLGSSIGKYEEKKDFIAMLNQKEFSDITLNVDGNLIFAHQVILASRSLYFEAIFSHDFKEKE